jgi:ribosomal protein L11 methyltransferase
VGADPAVRIALPAELAEAAGAFLFDLLGPYQEIEAGEARHLVFYPFRHGVGFVSDEAIRAALPTEDLRAAVTIERVLVPGGWEEGWKSHFRPLCVRALRVRPPWEAGAGGYLDLVLTPGLAFGTGLHPTTRGMLELLQEGEPDQEAELLQEAEPRPSAGGGAPRGPLLDCGTGSGILAIAGVLLGYSPVRGFDNDPLAVEAARANAAENGTALEILVAEVERVPLDWFGGATVVANMTLDPVIALLARLGKAKLYPSRLLVAGILSGEQEGRVGGAATAAGLRPVERIYEKEWVSFDFRPAV